MTDRDQFPRVRLSDWSAVEFLHGSESLCKLLRYLAKHALDHPGTPLKEYQIATEVFGRPADFDPQLDSTIRVQAGRLRVNCRSTTRGKGSMTRTWWICQRAHTFYHSTTAQPHPRGCTQLLAIKQHMRTLVHAKV